MLVISLILSGFDSPQLAAGSFIKNTVNNWRIDFFVQNFSYALVDVSAYGWYAFKGTIKDTGVDDDIGELLINSKQMMILY